MFQGATKSSSIRVLDSVSRNHVLCEIRARNSRAGSRLLRTFETRNSIALGPAGNLVAPPLARNLVTSSLSAPPLRPRVCSFFPTGGWWVSIHVGGSNVADLWREMGETCTSGTHGMIGYAGSRPFCPPERSPLWLLSEKFAVSRLRTKRPEHWCRWPLPPPDGPHCSRLVIISLNDEKLCRSCFVPLVARGPTDYRARRFFPRIHGPFCFLSVSPPPPPLPSPFVLYFRTL